MDVLWNACLTAVAVMVGVPVLAALLGLCGRLALRLARRGHGQVVQLALPLRDNPAHKLERLRAGMGLH
jgi:hypothetical protein